MNGLRATFKPIIAVLALATALGCQPTGGLNGLEGANAASQVAADIVWPEPPDPARIRYVRSISTPGDVGIKRGFFGALLDAVTRKAEERFIRPTGVADSDGAIYVADPGRRRSGSSTHRTRPRSRFVNSAGTRCFRRWR